MKLSTKAVFICCCLSIQMFTAHGKPNPEHFLIETDNAGGKDIKDPKEAGADNQESTKESECSTTKECQDLDKCAGVKCQCENGVCERVIKASDYGAKIEYSVGDF